jgi:hypothetical protein
MTDIIDFTDPEVYELIQRSDRPTFSQKENSLPSQNLSNKENNIDIVVLKNREGSLEKFIKRLILISVCLFLLYLVIYRYIIGFNFLKNKEYMKSMAVLSPEMITVSSFLL